MIKSEEEADAYHLWRLLAAVAILICSHEETICVFTQEWLWFFGYSVVLGIAVFVFDTVHCELRDWQKHKKR